MKRVVKIDLSVIVIFLVLLVSSQYVISNYMCIGCYDVPPWVLMFPYVFWASIIVLIGTIIHLLIKK